MKDVIDLYHGTTADNAKIITDLGINVNANLHPGDFGRGFYLAPAISQVKFHATKRRRNTKKNGDGVILHYRITKEDMEILNPLEFKFKTYDWGNMIYKQRVLEQDTKDNVIIGPIADGSIPGIVNSCRAGVIDKNDFIRAAAYGELGIQYVFKTIEAIDKLVLVEAIKEWW